MSISEKIVAAEKALEERRDQLLEVSKQYEENPEPEMLEALEEATEGVDHQLKELETYRRIEKSLTAQVSEKAAVSAPAVVRNNRRFRSRIRRWISWCHLNDHQGRWRRTSDCRKLAKRPCRIL